MEKLTFIKLKQFLISSSKNISLQFEIFWNVFEKVLIQTEIGLINCPDIK